MTAQLDAIIHQPIRLQIISSLVTLNQGDQVDFTFLRKLLKVTDGNLGAHLAKLESVAYIKIDKVFVNRRPRTFISVTGKGRDAFAEHIAVLKKIIGQTDRKNK